MPHDYSNYERSSQDDIRPAFHVGQHDSTRFETLTSLQYGHVLNAGVSAAAFYYHYLITLL